MTGKGKALPFQFVKGAGQSGEVTGLGAAFAGGAGFKVGSDLVGVWAWDEFRTEDGLAIA